MTRNPAWGGFLTRQEPACGTLRIKRLQVRILPSAPALTCADTC